MQRKPIVSRRNSLLRTAYAQSVKKGLSPVQAVARSRKIVRLVENMRRPREFFLNSEESYAAAKNTEVRKHVKQVIARINPAYRVSDTAANDIHYLWSSVRHIFPTKLNPHNPHETSFSYTLEDMAADYARVHFKEGIPHPTNHLEQKKFILRILHHRKVEVTPKVESKIEIIGMHSILPEIDWVSLPEFFARIRQEKRNLHRTEYQQRGVLMAFNDELMAFPERFVRFIRTQTKGLYVPVTPRELYQLGEKIRGIEKMQPEEIQRIAESIRLADFGEKLTKRFVKDLRTQVKVQELTDEAEAADFNRWIIQCLKRSDNQKFLAGKIAQHFAARKS